MLKDLVLYVLSPLLSHREFRTVKKSPWPSNHEAVVSFQSFRNVVIKS